MKTERELFPEINVLNTDGEEATARIFDAEMDVLNVKFTGANCVEIDTKKLTYITFSIDDLDALRELIIEAEEYYEETANEDYDE